MDPQEEYDQLTKKREHEQPTGIDTGACTDFCPRHELLYRTINNDISPLEHQNGTFIPVKKYYRPAAGYQGGLPEDIRMPDTLLACLKYLLGFPIELNNFQFLENRMRAIRGDIVVQHCSPAMAMDLLESMARWYIGCIYILHGKDTVDLHLIMDQARKTLSILYELYKENKVFSALENRCNINEQMDDASDMHDASDISNTNNTTNTNTGNHRPNAYEFVAYHILCNMNSPGMYAFFGINHPYVRQSLRLLSYYQVQDFFHYFRIVPDFMTASILCFWNGAMGKRTVEIMQHALNEEVDVAVLDRILNFSAKGLFESFFYKAEKSVDFRIENTSSREYRGEGFLCKNPRFYTEHGNADFTVYHRAVHAYLLRRHRVHCMYRAAARQWCADAIQLCKRRRAVLSAAIEAVYAAMARKLVAGMGFRLAAKDYLKKLCRIRNKVLVVYQCDSMPDDTHGGSKKIRIRYDRMHNQACSQFINSHPHAFININRLTEEKALEYNLTLFITDENLRGPIHERFPQIHKSINGIGADGRPDDLEDMVCKRIYKIRIPEIFENKSTKEKLEVLVGLREHIGLDYGNMVQCILDGRPIREKIMYIKVSEHERLFK